MAITKNIGAIRHGLISSGIGEEVFGLLNDVLHVRADEAECASSDALRAFGLAPQDEDGLAERRPASTCATGIL